MLPGTSRHNKGQSDLCFQPVKFKLNKTTERKFRIEGSVFQIMCSLSNGAQASLAGLGG